MFLVDSHCHLNLLNYKSIHKNIEDVLLKSYKKDVKLILSVSTSLLDYEHMCQHVGFQKGVFFSCGIHPINVSIDNIVNYNKLYQLSANKHVIAIGETGLDYYHQLNNYKEQKKSFLMHIHVAKSLNKPIIVHSRNAIQDTLELLRSEHAEKCSGILHCFSENLESVKLLLDINFYISFSGMITFPRFYPLQKIIKYVPLDRILLETDSPYLAPVPYRGQENQPAYLYEIAKCVSSIKKIDINKLSCITTNNFFKLFCLDKKIKKICFT